MNQKVIFIITCLLFSLNLYLQFDKQHNEPQKKVEDAYATKEIQNALKKYTQMMNIEQNLVKLVRKAPKGTSEAKSRRKQLFLIRKKRYQLWQNWLKVRKRIFQYENEIFNYTYTGSRNYGYILKRLLFKYKTLIN